MPRVPAALVAASGRASTGAGGGDGERAGGRAGAARAAGGRAACAPGGSESRGGWGVGSAPGGRWEERGFCTTGTDAEIAGGWLVFPRFHMEPPASAPSTPKSARQSANHPTFFVTNQNANLVSWFLDHFAPLMLSILSPTVKICINKGSINLI